MFLIGLAVPAQQPEKLTTFEATSDLIVVDVAVRDKNGRPLEGLKKEDFTVLEDGKAQPITVFEFQRLTLEPLPASQLPAAAAPQPQVSPRADAEVAPASRYSDRRLLVLFFDLSAMLPAEQARAQEAALGFLREKMTSADLVSIMTFSNRLRVVQDFTDDRDRLAAVIRGFRGGALSELAADSDPEENTGAAFVADQTEFNIFNTDRKLSALQTAVTKLGSLPEKKALVYFSSGTGKTGTENHSQLRATVNAAVRANVAFYPVDARGLMALPPGGDASRAAPKGTDIFTGATQKRQKEKFNDQQETLYTLAADTGGKAFLDNNDLAVGIVQAQAEVRSYYILGYYSTNAEHDGRYRRIRVALAGNPQAKLDFRSGYFAAKEFGQFTAADKERHLEEALLLGNAVTDLPLALEVDYFRLAADRYFVPVAVKIPGSEISLARRGSNEETEFDFIGQIRDQKDKLVGNVRDAIRVKLDEANAAQLGRRHLQYDTGFVLPPGAYKLRFLARENRTGKMGTFETTFEVPNLAAQSDGLRVSSVIWSSQREPLQSAVGSALGSSQKEKNLLANHPLIQDGQKLIPSITRVFRKDQNLYVYFEVYDPGLGEAQKNPNVAASLSFFNGRVKVFESTPVRLTQMTGVRQQKLPIQFQIPLSALAAGRYTCQVSVIDDAGGKFAFRRAPLVILP